MIFSLCVSSYFSINVPEKVAVVEVLVIGIETIFICGTTILAFPLVIVTVALTVSVGAVT